MALPLRPRSIPQCSACIRTYTFGALSEPAATHSALNQQVRGKKKLANGSNTVSVRLLKDVKTFGRKGAIVPISIGQMRNNWFPRRVAEYIAVPELKTLKLKNIAAERDFDYGVTNLAKEAAKMGVPGAIGKYQADIPTDIRGGMSGDEKVDASMFQKKVETGRLNPERSLELLDIFVPKTVEFWRQPILETPEPETKKPSMRGFGTGAGAELLAARAGAPQPKKTATGNVAIYGSVSTMDILNAVKAAMAENDESARVVLHAEQIKFVDLPADMQNETDKVKAVGEYTVQITPKASEEAITRAVKVHAQQS
ncbi:hypothetical protein D0869_11547 [Hortaea werneckii]|uniref:Ribosomal protein L9 domain-containing protein n=1 Tax=Hortaea werneckii TaxID=91943 RepID=A0A3M6WAX6_HORWE|nr:hypothetical protein KC324_g15155 [Hortaea werneckii]KAI7583369.1 hypothetical protein KC316_g7332 [Hortaea werneckii]RMX75521.1 hypothetical protein D0869_11547 [Hortaea werneckii]RMY02234.1 hypothetical protein D0868_08070 [Hortaea werneckii]